MSEFSARQSATEIEVLAKEALHESDGVSTAEEQLINVVRELQKDPEHFKAVQNQISQDNLLPNSMPSINFGTGNNGKSTEISIDVAKTDIGMPCYEETINFDSQIWSISKTPWNLAYPFAKTSVNMQGLIDKPVAAAK